MNCPSCGSTINDTQQFCRSCGAALIADPPRRMNDRAVGLIVLMLTFGGLLMAMSGKMLSVRWLVFAGVFIMIGGMFSVAAYSLIRSTRPRRRSIGPTKVPAPLADLQAADTTNKLPPIAARDFFPSAVEETTDLLDVPAIDRKAMHG